MIKTVIVPVDFSETSLHAAKYAAQLLMGHYGVKMYLFHAYDDAVEEPTVQASLEALKSNLYRDYIVDMQTISIQEPDLIVGLEKTVKEYGADLVIMGITGRSGLEQVLFGSNTLRMAATKACPVLIVPEQAPLADIRNAMFCSDFKNTDKSTPVAPIKSILKTFSAQLHIVNVDKNHYISLSEAYVKEKENLAALFEGMNPEFYFMRLYEVDEALHQFATDKNIDLIIAVQKEHSFMDRLLQKSHTKKLSYHSHIPILVIHE